MVNVKKGLIIFARKPVLGKVKTRLAATVGEVKALEVYKKLLFHTRTVANATKAKSFAFLTEADEENFWNGFSCELQSGETLGDRMCQAFSLVFKSGVNECIIIGSDCPGLTKEIVDDAFLHLKSKDIVIGAAADGGYYLLGMKKIHRSLFENKNWSTENVFVETLMDVKKLNLSYQTMPILIDVDEEKDVPPEWL